MALDGDDAEREVSTFACLLCEQEDAVDNLPYSTSGAGTRVAGILARSRKYHRLKLQNRFNMGHNPAAFRASVPPVVASDVASRQSARMATRLQFDQRTDARCRANEDVSDVMLLAAHRFEAYVGVRENTDKAAAAQRCSQLYDEQKGEHKKDWFRRVACAGIEKKRHHFWYRDSRRDRGKGRGRWVGPRGQGPGVWLQNPDPFHHPVVALLRRPRRDPTGC